MPMTRTDLTERLTERILDLAGSSPYLAERGDIECVLVDALQLAGLDYDTSVDHGHRLLATLDDGDRIGELDALSGALADAKRQKSAEVDRLRADNDRLRAGIAGIADRREADARVYQTTREVEQAGYHRGMAKELRRLIQTGGDATGAAVPSEDQRLRAGLRALADDFGTKAAICTITGQDGAAEFLGQLHDRLYALLNGDADAEAVAL